MTIKLFIIPVYPYGNDHYYHEMIALAEGFTELGYKVIGNCNYWYIPSLNKYLIEEDLNGDFDIGIYDYRYATSFAHLFFRKGYPNFDRSKKHVLIDRNDWHSPIWINDKRYLDVFDVIAAGNLYKDYVYPQKIKPWAIGLTNRIIHSIDQFYTEEKERDAIIGYNFRVGHNMRSGLLKALQEKKLKYPVVPKFTDKSAISVNSDDYEFYKKSTERHSLPYYKVLTESLGFLTFGGYYEMKPYYYEPYTLMQKAARKLYYLRYKQIKKRGEDFSKMVFIFQQDSFRFWETLYSGAVSINIDLDFWNFMLPENPISGKQYLGISSVIGKNFDKSLNRMSEEELKKIGQKGRQWVFENYSPKAQAQRVLDYLKGKMK